MIYYKPLDGIRAIAIIAVIIYHISPTTLRGGFTGVDVFFVLSGFLITTIVLNDLREGRFSIKEFYTRRIQRLLPNMIAVILAVQFLWTLFFPPSTARATGIHGIWTLLSASNIYIWQQLGGYWSDSAEWAPLTHTWSLGIEEQFYLFFPITLSILFKTQSGRLNSLLILATVLSFIVCILGSYLRPIATFYLLPTRVWELLLGTLLAVHRNRTRPGESSTRTPSKLSQTAGGWIGAAIILAGFFTIDEMNAFPGWICLFPTVGTVLLIASVVDGNTVLSKWLSSRFMTTTGKLSYSLYLWHWPIITFGKIQAGLYGYPKSIGALAGGIGSILLAVVAYKFVEQPLRETTEAGRPKRLLVIASGFFAVALFSHHLASRQRVADPNHLFNPITFSGRLLSAADTSSMDLTNVIRYYDVHFPSNTDHSTDSWRRGGIIHKYDGGNPQVVVLGSSHALMYAQLIDSICMQKNISVSFLCIDGGCAFFEHQVSSNFPTPRESMEFDDARRKFLRQWRPKAVLVIDRWDRHPNEKDFETRFRSFLEEVAPLTERVVFVSQVPVHLGGDEVNLRELVNWRMKTTRTLPPLRPDLKDDLRRNIAHRAELLMSEFENLRILKADGSFYLPDGSIHYASGKDFFYADDDHLSDAGSEVVRPLFEQAIIEAQSATSN